MSNQKETPYQRRKRREFERHLDFLKQEYTRMLATEQVDELREKMSTEGKFLPWSEAYRLRTDYEDQLQFEVEQVFQNPHLINYVKETIVYNKQLKSVSRSNWFFFKECLRLHRQEKTNAEPS